MTGPLHEDAGPLLAVEGLSVAYATPRGPARVLRDVSFALARGESLGVVGESGCGKSTLVKALIRLLPKAAKVESGAIRFEGRDLLGLPDDAMRRLRGDRLSMVFQDPMTTLNPVRSIARQMTDIQYRTGRSRAEKRARAVAMLARVGIPDPERRIDEHAHAFSGGMRQRIGIAMAMMAEPALLLADEPTTALDATLEVQIVDLMADLRRETGSALVVVSHHLGVIDRLCQRVIVMYAGEIVEAGPTARVFSAPAHPYTARLLDCDPARIATPTRVLPTIPGEVPDLAALPEGCVFRARCPKAVAACARERPRLRQAHADHAAACHLVGEGAAREEA